jgi:hypothetical protein
LNTDTVKKVYQQQMSLRIKTLRNSIESELDQCHSINLIIEWEDFVECENPKQLIQFYKKVKNFNKNEEKEEKEKENKNEEKNNIEKIYCCFPIVLEFIGFYHELKNLKSIFNVPIDKYITGLDFEHGTKGENLMILNLHHNHLQYLDCGKTDLKSLPALPLVTYLSCYLNDLTALPALPLNKYLDCTSNKLTALPALPLNEKLCCGFNKITSLPSLPLNKHLECGFNELTTLPDLSFNEFLQCNCNDLTSLPALPLNKYLNCGYNQLSVLPELPLNTVLV